MKMETGEEGYFTKGLSSKEDLVKQYWESMITVEEYLKRKPYKNPEILVFETIPKKFLSILVFKIFLEGIAADDGEWKQESYYENLSKQSIRIDNPMSRLKSLIS
ncbi:hypothetical protein [Lysinibacillus sp. NPDC059133]|uniref:hypothetical protein n=1 Tax=Lysinibacillus sp. NPDC059133 TaxID=3346737 RepID=UPI0036984AA0